MNKILNNFYKIHKNELEQSLKENNFKKEYVKNIGRIHENIANEIVYKYENRITLSTRIKELDCKQILKEKFKYEHCKAKNNEYSVYKYLANTRNYYTHLDNNKYIIKDQFIPNYCRKMERILINELLSVVINDQSYVEEKIKKDEYLTIYDYQD